MLGSMPDEEKKHIMNGSDDLEMSSLLNLDFICEKWLKQMNKCIIGQWLAHKGHWMFAIMQLLWFES